LEDPRLLRGQGQFTDDVSLPGQVFAAFVRAPHAHARIVRVQTAAHGALAVWTAADYLADGCVGIRHGPVPADALDVERPAFSTALDEPHWPLALEFVRYPGEAVAVVVAETAAAAQDAAERIRVDYEVLPAVVDMDQALEPGAPAVWASAPGNVALDATFGDPASSEAAIRTAPIVIEHEARSQRIANAQLEPRSALGSYDAEHDTYLMIAGSQGALRQRATLAAALGVLPDRVRVISPDVGGGFGPRTSLYPEQVIVTWAARRLGRPVRWTSTRTEAFLTDFQGRDSRATARLGLDRSGRILALAVDLVFNVGGQTVSYVPLSNAARILTSVYDVPVASARVRAILTNSVPTGPYRGAGRPETIFSIERLLDRAAKQLGIDRVEIRRRNLIERARLPYRSAMGLTYDSGDFAANMDRAIQQSDWVSFERRRQSAHQRGKLAGIGLANYIEAPVGAPHERVAIAVLPQGIVEVTVGTQSTGQGHATVYAQVVADALGVEPTAVRLVSGDTRAVASGGGTHSDRSMRIAGTLLVEASARIRAQVATLVAQLHRPLDVFEASDVAPLAAEASFSGRLPAHPTGAAVCEVEIDPETGTLEVVRYTSVDDVGQPINPSIVHGQTHGGIAQGLGQALSERVVLDAASGQVQSGSFADYAVPAAAGLPRFDVSLVEDPTQGNPLRVKGGGESGITPALASVVNAALDALAPLGVDDLEMPLSAARIWHAIDRAARTPS
jgi:carbon-monoxide dehydrogenase large subunit